MFSIFFILPITKIFVAVENTKLLNKMKYLQLPKIKFIEIIHIRIIFKHLSRLLRGIKYFRKST